MAGTQAIPAPIVVKTDERAASLKMTRSEYIRSLIDKDLASAT